MMLMLVWLSGFWAGLTCVGLGMYQRSRRLERTIWPPSPGIIVAWGIGSLILGACASLVRYYAD